MTAPRKKAGAPRKKAGAPGASASLDIRAQYDAGGMGRRMRGWNPPASGPSRATAQQPKVRDRARDSTRNDSMGSSGVRKWTTTLIGIGIVPRFKRIKSRARRAELSTLFADWVKEADADGNGLNYYALQTLATRSWISDGEVFGRIRMRRPDAPLTVPMQVQLIESDMVPMGFDADMWPGLAAGSTIRQGIERNRYGRRTAVWMYRVHPGEGSAVRNDLLIRVPIEQMIHVYEPTRPGQLRGVSVLAPVLAWLRDVADYNINTLDRMKLANLFMAFIKRNAPEVGDEDFDPLTGQPLNSTESPMASMMPGTVQELNPGEDVEFANPPEAGTTFSEYMRSANVNTAAGVDMPYEIMSGDIKDVSDRTLRVVINEMRRLAEQRQHQIIIPMFCERILSAWAEAGALVGKIGVDEIADVKRAEHATHGWAHIHPVQDPQGKKLEVDAGFRSRASVVSGYGDDIEDVDDERASDKKREDDLGLTPVPIDPNATPDPNEPQSGNKQGTKK